MNPKTRNEFLQYSHPLTLDLNTVHQHLHLSEGNTLITLTDTEQSYPDHPDRFDQRWQALCKESVSGCSYWEFECSGNVAIAVLYKRIRRKGPGYECWFGFNDDSWSLDFFQLYRCTFWHRKIESFVCRVPTSRRIGVYVDHIAGDLSFYSVIDTMTHLHSIQTTFTQPLYPGIRLCTVGSTVKLIDLSE